MVNNEMSDDMLGEPGDLIADYNDADSSANGPLSALSKAAPSPSPGKEPNESTSTSDESIRLSPTSLYCSVPLNRDVQSIIDTFPKTEAEKSFKKTRKLPCLYCDRTFVADNLRQKHVERSHSIKQARRSSSRFQQSATAINCLYCDKFAVTKNGLDDLFVHLVRSHHSKYFGCLECHERFTLLSQLDEHNEESHGIKRELKVQSVDETSDTKNNSAISVIGTTKNRHKVKIKGETHSSDQARPNLRRIKQQVVQREIKNKRVAIKSTKLGIKRSTRLQAKVIPVKSTRKKQKPKERTQDPKLEKEKEPETPNENPYPTFDAFYRVKKITDHSIDNLRISSLTFSDVFDQAFFTRIKCNIRENLLNHIDGKLFNNEESESRISNFEKTQPEISSNDNYGCDLSINAATPMATSLLTTQFGDDPEYQIEYGSKASKKKTTTKQDEVHYKYFTRRKYQASILESKENRDLSKLDMWTQFHIKNRQQKMLEIKKSDKEKLDYKKGEEYRAKIQNDELNKILDRRGPFEDLKEEATKKAALEGNFNTEVQNEVSCILEDVLGNVFGKINEVEIKTELTDSEIPSYLNLHKASLNNDSHIDKSDRITLICSSQETENFEVPQTSPRDKNTLEELTGEWARSRLYICAACGLKMPNIKLLIDHKNIVHQNVWCQHYEFVGNQGKFYKHLSIPGLGKMEHVESNTHKLWRRSEARVCSKCKKQCNSLGELHRHILECGEDWSWMLVRKKCKYKPFGAKTRKKRRGLFKRIIQKDKTNEEQKEKKTYPPRPKPSDAETIQRMLANLPAKRATRKIMSLKDGFPKKSKMSTNNKQNKIINNRNMKMHIRRNRAEMLIQESNQLLKGKLLKSSGLKCNPASTLRKSVRNINKVISSKLIDNNGAALMLKRKLKNALNQQRITRRSLQVPDEVKVTDEEEVEDVPVPEVKEKRGILKKVQNLRKSIMKKKTKDTIIDEKKPEDIAVESDDIVRKTRSGTNLSIETENDAPLSENIPTLTEAKKTTKSTVGAKIMRTLSLRKKIKTDKSDAVEIETSDATDVTKNTGKRKSKFQAIKNVVKKMKFTKKTSISETLKNASTIVGDHFLEEGSTETITKPLVDAAVSDVDVISKDSNSKAVWEDSTYSSNTIISNTNDVSEMMINVGSEYPECEKGFDSQGIDDTSKTDIACAYVSAPTEVTDVTAEDLGTKVAEKTTIPKAKLCKRAKGLNACIAMLTNKLQLIESGVIEAPKVRVPVIAASATVGKPKQFIPLIIKTEVEDPVEEAPAILEEPLNLMVIGSCSDKVLVSEAATTVVSDFTAVPVIETAEMVQMEEKILPVPTTQYDDISNDKLISESNDKLISHIVSTDKMTSQSILTTSNIFNSKFTSVSKSNDIYHGQLEGKSFGGDAHKNFEDISSEPLEEADQTCLPFLRKLEQNVDHLSNEKLVDETPCSVSFIPKIIENDCDNASSELLVDQIHKDISCEPLVDQLLDDSISTELLNQRSQAEMLTSESKSVQSASNYHSRKEDSYSSCDSISSERMVEQLHQEGLESISDEALVEKLSDKGREYLISDEHSGEEHTHRFSANIPDDSLVEKISDCITVESLGVKLSPKVSYKTFDKLLVEKLSEKGGDSISNESLVENIYHKDSNIISDELSQKAGDYIYDESLGENVSHKVSDYKPLIEKPPKTVDDYIFGELLAEKYSHKITAEPLVENLSEKNRDYVSDGLLGEKLSQKVSSYISEKSLGEKVSNKVSDYISEKSLGEDLSQKISYKISDESLLEKQSEKGRDYISDEPLAETLPQKITNYISDTPLGEKVCHNVGHTFFDALLDKSSEKGGHCLYNETFVEKLSHKVDDNISEKPTKEKFSHKVSDCISNKSLQEKISQKVQDEDSNEQLIERQPRRVWDNISNEPLVEGTSINVDNYNFNETLMKDPGLKVYNNILNIPFVAKPSFDALLEPHQSKEILNQPTPIKEAETRTTKKHKKIGSLRSSRVTQKKQTEVVEINSASKPVELEDANLNEAIIMDDNKSHRVRNVNKIGQRRVVPKRKTKEKVINYAEDDKVIDFTPKVADKITDLSVILEERLGNENDMCSSGSILCPMSPSIPVLTASSNPVSSLDILSSPVLSYPVSAPTASPSLPPLPQSLEITPIPPSHPLLLPSLPLPPMSFPHPPLPHSQSTYIPPIVSTALPPIIPTSLPESLPAHNPHSLSLSLPCSSIPTSFLMTALCQSTSSPLNVKNTFETDELSLISDVTDTIKDLSSSIPFPEETVSNENNLPLLSDISTTDLDISNREELSANKLEKEIENEIVEKPNKLLETTLKSNSYLETHFDEIEATPIKRTRPKKSSTSKKTVSKAITQPKPTSDTINEPDILENKSIISPALNLDISINKSITNVLDESSDDDVPLAVLKKTFIETPIAVLEEPLKTITSVEAESEQYNMTQVMSESSENLKIVSLTPSTPINKTLSSLDVNSVSRKHKKRKSKKKKHKHNLSNLLLFNGNIENAQTDKDSNDDLPLISLVDNSVVSKDTSISKIRKKDRMWNMESYVDTIISEIEGLRKDELDFFNFKSKRKNKKKKSISATNLQANTDLNECLNVSTVIPNGIFKGDQTVHEFMIQNQIGQMEDVIMEKLPKENDEQVILNGNQKEVDEIFSMKQMQSKQQDSANNLPVTPELNSKSDETNSLIEDHLELDISDQTIHISEKMNEDIVATPNNSKILVEDSILETPTKSQEDIIPSDSFIQTPDLNSPLLDTLTKKLNVKVKRSKNGKFAKKSPEEKSEAVSNYCDICDKHFVRTDSLVKHKRTLTHIAKLSEIEAKEAEEKAKQRVQTDVIQKQQEDIDIQPSIDDKEASDKNITEKEIETDKNITEKEISQSMLVTSPFSLKTNNDTLKLADIINDVLNKPVSTENMESFSDMLDQKQEPKRYKSLGERKSFDSDSIIYNPTKPPYSSNIIENKITNSTDAFLQKQISLLENMIEENKASFQYMEEISVNSNKSDERCPSDMSLVSDIKQDESNIISFSHDTNIVNSLMQSDSNFVKPTQYEEISEDSMTTRTFDDQRSRKALNRDEELFLECCSLLKSSSEVSNFSKQSRTMSMINTYGFKPDEEPEWLERKTFTAKYKNNDKDQEFLSEDSCRNTPIGDNYEDFSNSDTIKTDWNMKMKEREFEDISVDSVTHNSGNNARFNVNFNDKSNTSNVSKFSVLNGKAGDSVIDNGNGLDFRKEDEDQLDVISIKSDDTNSKSSARQKSSTETTQTSITDYVVPIPKKLEICNDSLANDKKMLTKGAKKVFEGLKVSIPTEDLDMNEVLNCSPTSKRPEPTDNNKSEMAAKPIKTKPKNNLKKFGNKLGLKITKKRNKPLKQQEELKVIESENKIHDIYDFEETQDNTDVFAPSNLRSFRSQHNEKLLDQEVIEAAPIIQNDQLNDIESDGETNNQDTDLNFEAQSVSSFSTETESTTSMNNTTGIKNITKKKCVIMGRIFKNAFKSKTDEIKDIPTSDNTKVVENYFQNCPNTSTPKNTPIDRLKMTEKEMDMLFDQLLEETSDKSKAQKKVPHKSDDSKLLKLKPKVLKQKKRVRKPSLSSDDEFNLTKLPKKRFARKKGKEQNAGINLEQELKECMGVAGRKSQRKCTSGKQNVLVEVWSSDSDSDLETVMQLSLETAAKEATIEPIPIENIPTEHISNSTPETKIIEPPLIETVKETPTITEEKKEIKQKPHRKLLSKSKPTEKLPKMRPPTTETLASNRRKRAAADTLYYWSSSSDDDSQNLIEVKSVRDDGEEYDDNRPMQHGWIVGDSPKKLVTMLAQAKGKKVDAKCVKEQTKKRTSI